LVYSVTVLSLAARPDVRTVRGMVRESVDAPEAKLLGRALGLLRRRAEMSQQGAGDAYGISDEGWRKYEAGLAKAIFSPETQTKLARAVGFTREDLLDERARLAGEDPPSQARASPAERQSWIAARADGGGHGPALGILDTVQAGAWLAIDDTGQAVPPASNVLPDPRFPHARQYVSVVRGDSMNLLGIVDGDWVHWVEAADLGYYPRAGDVVRVERVRFAGQEREVTLKQVELGADGIVLWPRSSNPRWKSPVELRAGLRESEDVEVVIRGLVLSVIRRL
jgi:SOS-response transcriptional repressor LexA